MLVLGGKILKWNELPHDWKTFNYPEINKWVYDTRFRRPNSLSIIEHYSFDIASSLCSKFKNLKFQHGLLKDLTNSMEITYHSWCSVDSIGPVGRLLVDFCIPTGMRQSVLAHEDYRYKIIGQHSMTKKCLNCGLYFIPEKNELYCRDHCEVLFMDKLIPA